jgi:hypothetical protein
VYNNLHLYCVFFKKNFYLPNLVDRVGKVKMITGDPGRDGRNRAFLLPGTGQVSHDTYGG